MKTVIQRVSKASVQVNGEIAGSINHGLLVLLGIHYDDSDKQIEWMCNKILNLRVFEDDEGKMNRSVTDVEGGILVVSQFTLYGTLKKGTRPGFTDAAKPEKAIPLYEKTIQYLKNNSSLRIETGEFGAMMQVELINDGPVTIILEK
jgi:D-tyrosyl-tRNA(Tyr) deacylase